MTAGQRGKGGAGGAGGAGGDELAVRRAAAAAEQEQVEAEARLDRQQAEELRQAVASSRVAVLLGASTQLQLAVTAVGELLRTEGLHELIGDRAMASLHNAAQALDVARSLASQHAAAAAAEGEQGDQEEHW